MNCNYCESSLAPLYMISTNGSPTFKMFEPNLCPHCGKSFTEPKPLTLEQLKQMDGLPVWIVTLEEPELYPPFWAIVDVDHKKGIGVRLVAKHDHDDFGAYELYGETWVAYDKEYK